MTEKFTQGEWVAKNIDDLIQIESSYTGFLVCKIINTTPMDSHNAHLISAAPDMYQALWAMIELHQADFGCKGLDEPAIDKACAALAKARGDA